MFRLRDWLLDSGMTAVITAQVEGDAPFVSQRHGFMQFMADCVVSLSHDVSNPTASRSLRVSKYRGSGFAEQEFPFIIGPAGLEVGYAPKAASTGIQEEIKLAKGEFRARIETLNRQLEIKQAELDFLLKASAKQKDKGEDARSLPVGRTSRKLGSRRTKALIPRKPVLAASNPLA
jgi:circadian clock protein KaiC